MKYHVRSAKIHFWQNELHRSLQSIAIFSKLTSLTVCLTMDRGFERNLCVTVISSLSKLPFYDNLEHLTFEWADQPVAGGLSCPKITLDSDSEDEELRVTYRRGPKEIKLQKTYRQNLARLDPEVKEFLGPFIKGGELSKVVRELKFPKYLRSLDFYVQCEDASYALPFFKHCGGKVDLGLFVRGGGLPVLDLDKPEAGAVELHDIKRLSLGFPNKYDPIKVKYLPTQFPNLEVLKLIDYTSYDAEELWETLPDLPNLQRIEYPWPREPGEFSRPGGVTLEAVQVAMGKRMKEGGFRCLRWVKIEELWQGSDGEKQECDIRRDGDGYITEYNWDKVYGKREKRWFGW